MKRVDIKYDLSIGIIVKNKDKYLEDCLKVLLPLKDTISCEIIVTDTGSTDKTVEIAQKYADKVLHFEWCDDFSAARNTGVEASCGRWFMYIDVDELFDKSVVDIAKFLKSKDCDKYDSATYIQRNYKKNQSKEYFDFNLERLFNFKNSKRYFNGIIHEYIETTHTPFKINAVAKHCKNISSLAGNNKTLLKKQLEYYPNDIQSYKKLFDIVSTQEKIKLANKALDIIESVEDGDYKDIQNQNYIFLIYCQLAYTYNKSKSYNLVIETCERYLKNELVVNFRSKNILPTLEISYMYANALFEAERFQYALDIIINYQKKYLHLRDVKDSVFEGAYEYKYNNKLEYSKSLVLVLDCYHKLNDREAMIKILYKFEAYKTNEVKIRNYILNNYVKYILEYDKQDLLDKVVSYFTSNNEDIYNNSEFVIFFYANFMFNGNIDCYLQNCSYSVILNYIDLVFNSDDFKILDKLFEYITNNTDFSNLKQMLIYIKLMELYLINMSKANINKVEDEEKINHIFELYIKNVYLYVKTAYNDAIFESNQFSLFEDYIVFGYLVYPALEQKKNEQNFIEYMKTITGALTYFPKFKNTVSIVVNYVEKFAENEKVNIPKPNNEFSLLSEKIKLTIIDAIKANDEEKAELIIEKYKKINPTDPDIANLSNLIKN